MNWDQLEGKRINGLYMGLFPYSGTVESSRVKYGGKVQHTVVVDEPFKVYGEMRERLIINHIVILYNLFGPEAATKMLFFKIEKKFWTQLKTFLVFLNYLSEESYVDVPLDQTVILSLRRKPFGINTIAIRI